MDFPAPADTYPDKDPGRRLPRGVRPPPFDLPIRLNSPGHRALRRTGEHFQVRTADQSLLPPRPGRRRHRTLRAAVRPVPLAERLEPARHPAAQLRSTATRATCRTARSWWSAPETPACRSPRSWSPAAPVELSVGARPTVLPQRLARPGPVLVADQASAAGRGRLRRGSAAGCALPPVSSSSAPTGDSWDAPGSTSALGLADADGRTVRFADGTAPRGSAALIWATGFRADHSWLRIPDVAARRPGSLHRRGVTEVPGLYFLGLSWQHTRGSALLGFVAADAAYLAERLAVVRHAPAPPADTGRIRR